MPRSLEALHLPLFSQDRLGPGFREERVSEQVAAVLARVEPGAVKELLVRLANRAGAGGWAAPDPLVLRVEEERSHPEDGRRRLDLAWLHAGRVVFAIEVKIRHLAWTSGGPEREKFRSYAELIHWESPTDACLLALTPYALPPAEFAPARTLLPAGGIRWTSFCEELRRVGTDGRWPIAGVLFPELATLLGPEGLKLDFRFHEADMHTLSAYAAALPAVLQVQASLDSLGERLGAEFTELGLKRDPESEPEEEVTRLRSPYWVFEAADADVCAEGFVLAVQLWLDTAEVACFLGYYGESHSNAAAAAFAMTGLTLAWWGTDKERPRVGIAPEEWQRLVAEAGDVDWWGTAAVRPVAEVLPHGLSADAPLALAAWVAAELRRVGPRLLQFDVWPTIASWPVGWRNGQLAGHADFDPCPGCPVDEDLSRACVGQPLLGWGPVPCQAHLVRQFTDDTGKLRMKLPNMGSAWKGSPRSDGPYRRQGAAWCCGLDLGEIGKKRSLTCPTCATRHDRATLLALTASP